MEIEIGIDDKEKQLILLQQVTKEFKDKCTGLWKSLPWLTGKNEMPTEGI